MARKIALTGKIRSGKDTLADMYVSTHGFMRFAFGDGIRQVTQQLYPEQYTTGAKPRDLLQNFGQAARQFDADVWLNFALRAIHVWAGDDKDIVISDLRQPNEYDKLKELGFTIVRVNATDEIRLERSQAAGDNFTLADLNHETEQSIDSFVVDYEVDNNTTLQSLLQQGETILDEIGGGI